MIVFPEIIKNEITQTIIKYEQYVPHINTNASTYTQEDIYMINEVSEFMSNNKYKLIADKISKICKFTISNISGNDYTYYATHFCKDYDQMKNEYVERLLKEDIDTLYLMALEYKKNKLYKKMIWCYITIIHNGDISAGKLLGDFYKNNGIISEAEKYYIIALGIESTVPVNNDDLLSKINNITNTLYQLNEQYEDYIDIMVSQDKQIAKQQKQIDDLLINTKQYIKIIEENNLTLNEYKKTINNMSEDYKLKETVYISHLNDIKDSNNKQNETIQLTIDNYKIQINELLDCVNSLKKLVM
jgi:hypothetical protein